MMYLWVWQKVPDKYWGSAYAVALAETKETALDLVLESFLKQQRMDNVEEEYEELLKEKGYDDTQRQAAFDYNEMRRDKDFVDVEQWLQSIEPVRLPVIEIGIFLTPDC